MKKINFSDVSLVGWVKGILATVAYILLVIWIGNWWLLIGTPLVFDIYITKLINWGWWKHTAFSKKHPSLVSWVDAIVFALVAVYFINIFFFQNYKIPTSSLEKSLLVGDHLFVSKMSYGPRMPFTPIFMPLTQNTMPIGNCKSYLDWPMWDYHRLAGFNSVERGDIVVFNFPAGDSVCLNMPNPDYYSIILGEGANYVAQHNEALAGQDIKNQWRRNHMLMDYGRKRVKDAQASLGEIVWRPVDKRDCYVKRCIATPGDTLQIIHNQVYINNKPMQNPTEIQHNYFIKTNGVLLSDKFFENLGISNDDKVSGSIGTNYYLPLTEAKAAQVAKMPMIEHIEIEDQLPDSSGFKVFPYSSDYPWSRDNYGPIWMPKKGASITLDEKNILLYERIITSYEGHTLDLKADGTIEVDGKPTTTYTFAMDYYFMLGDNRHKSADSRYWGFVPEDHIVGKPLFVWLSLDPDKSFLSSIRWDRFFMKVK
ncbi:MAG: S26 family signal peptidase [Marinilabiliaceae bacterium]|nr:S26 family signal peptidase [Marinilabiliaceae bacterium]